MSIEKAIQQIHDDFAVQIKEARSSKELEDLKVHFLGKKGPISSLMPFLKDASKEEKPILGQKINLLKNEISQILEEKYLAVQSEELEKRLQQEAIDITLPGKKNHQGKLHPISQMLQKILDVLIDMGFSVQYGPDVDSDYYNFEGLNFPKDHPAREMQDTFYLTQELLLRTHTSNVQVRMMEKNTPPIRVIAPGRCFRNETVSSRSHVFFHQIEGFYIDTKATFADLLVTLDTLWERVFGYKIETRYRPSYFPFVEPGIEGDIRCTVCHGGGCRLCKHTGWLEVIGAGMIHPEVLKAGGLDPEKYQGFAFGLGIERMTMLAHDIKDIRLFTENDMRFLSQF